MCVQRSKFLAGTLLDLGVVHSEQQLQISSHDCHFADTYAIIPKTTI